LFNRSLIGLVRELLISSDLKATGWERGSSGIVKGKQTSQKCKYDFVEIMATGVKNKDLASPL